MNNDYLALAKKKITDSKVLTIVATKRAKQLAHGHAPLIACSEKERENHLDVALHEIAEGKIVPENLPEYLHQ